MSKLLVVLLRCWPCFKKPNKHDPPMVMKRWYSNNSPQPNFNDLGPIWPYAPGHWVRDKNLLLGFPLSPPNISNGFHQQNSPGPWLVVLRLEARRKPGLFHHYFEQPSFGSLDLFPPAPLPPRPAAPPTVSPPPPQENLCLFFRSLLPLPPQPPPPPPNLPPAQPGALRANNSGL